MVSHLYQYSKSGWKIDANREQKEKATKKPVSMCQKAQDLPLCLGQTSETNSTGYLHAVLILSSSYAPD
jgi:hypothetical protein